LSETVDLKDRDIRQRDLVPAEKLKDTTILVIGAGAVGRQVIGILSHMGASVINIVDPDTVSVENLAVQGYRPSQIGMPKVLACKQDFTEVNPGKLTIRTFQEKFSRYMKFPINGKLVVFSCVDSIESRRFIFEALMEAKLYKDKYAMFIDGRMAAEYLEVYTHLSGKSQEYYQESLGIDNQEFPASCTGRTTLYSCYTLAGMMVAEFVKWLRDQPLAICNSQVYNMFASDYKMTQHLD
jgi:molybdopterin/thiamine biosynthesis adenylyltransferase